jgi:hypothetical protein
MALKIRCPRCRHVLVVEDEKAGTRMRCPACQGRIDVPIPMRAARGATDVATQCPRCDRELAPGTSVCPHCATDMATGERLPLGRRLRLVSLRTWVLLAIGLTGIGLAGFVGISIYRDTAHKPERQSQPATGPALPTLSSADAAQRLLAAETSQERLAALERLRAIGTTAAPAVAAALESSLGGPAGRQKRRNQRAALELLAQGDDQRWQAVMQKSRRQRALRDDAVCGLARLGDAEVLDDVAAIWLRELRRRAFLSRLAGHASSDAQDAAKLVLERAAARTERVRLALRCLRREQEVPVLGRLGEAYWESWSWLGQSRGEVVAADIFEIAKPTDGQAAGPDGVSERGRVACRALERLSHEGTPPARAAAGLVLAQSAPQCKAERRRAIATLAAILPECEPREQQRLTWALAKLTGLTFGDISAEREPADVTPDDVQGALTWARRSEVANPGPLSSSAVPYPRPPILIRRVITAQRQLEHDLLEQFAAGWQSADAALDRWLAAGLGCTPRLLRRLDPRQRRPDYTTLAAAMILVAEYNEQTARDELELWRQATDQPAWVCEMAYTVLGCLDARVGRWKSGWPTDLDVDVYHRLDHGLPGWRHFGRIVAAGGPSMWLRLEQAAPESLPAKLRARLLAAAQESTRQRRNTRRP